MCPLPFALRGHTVVVWFAPERQLRAPWVQSCYVSVRFCLSPGMDLPQASRKLVCWMVPVPRKR